MTSVYFVGIKGVAMSALALLWKNRGMDVWGSDVAEKFPTDDELAAAGIRVLEGFAEDHITRPFPDLVIYTGAHGGSANPEVARARSLGIPVLTHAQALGQVMEGKTQISVAGSHGKTTTSAMIATILSAAGRDPSWAVGCGSIGGLGAAGHWGNGQYFVAEADEYVNDPGVDATPRFLWQHPDVLVVTNIDFDHPDVYGSLAEVTEAFMKFASQQKGLAQLILNEDDPASKPLRGRAKNLLTYGFSPNAMLRATGGGMGEGRTFFSLMLRDMAVGEFSLKVPGRHNIANAAAAAAACFSLGVSWEDIRKGLLAFTGTRRRLEEIAVTRGIRIIDDYAHHPKEIEASLAAMRAWYPKKRILTIFQPHTYSRTKALLTQFGNAFTKSDLVFLTDIYSSARENDTLGISGATVAQEVAKHHATVVYAKTYEQLEAEVRSRVREGDILIGMGAGSIYQWIHNIASSLS